MSKPDATPGAAGTRPDRSGGARDSGISWNLQQMGGGGDDWMVRGFPHPRKGGSWSSPPDRSIVNVERHANGDKERAALKVSSGLGRHRRRLSFRMKRSG